MLLKSLELQGFKSFPDKTVLEFDRGITGIVGPNGSGKSNISDAMKWVLGEVSSKNLRGSKMEDVIFGGADTRRQMGFAEVSITFDNTVETGGLLATAYDVVTVTRRIYRSGDSEYYLNRKPVRLRDIHELFMNTGIGRDGYSIIGQGKIAEIISKKNDERRSVFEEAAGISKYRYKKEEAERKLLAVDDNLTRVSDIVGELAARVEPLRIECEKARSYLELSEKKKECDISLWLFDMKRLQESIKELDAAYQSAETDYKNAVDALTEMENRSEQLYSLSQENKQKYDTLSETLSALSEKRIQLNAANQVLQSEIAHIIEKRALHTQEAEKRKQTEAETKEKQLAARDALDAVRKEYANAELVCAEDKRKSEECDHALDAAYAHLSDLNDAIAENVKQTGESRTKLTVLETTHSAAKEKLAALDENLKKYTDSIAMLSERAERAKQSADAYAQKKTTLEKQEQTARNALLEIQKQKKELEETQNRYYLDHSARKNRMDALSRMEELFEGYSRSVRFVMNEYDHGKLPSGTVLYGPLSKLISVKPNYTTAIETALGANIQNIAVANEASAKAAIRCLKDNNAGRATFYPIATMRSSDFNLDIRIAERQEGYVGLAHTLLSYDDKFDAVIRSLLGRTLVTDNIDHAAALANAYDYKVRIVTLDGQQINIGGSFTGGSVKHDSGILTRSAEIDRLRAECEALVKKTDEVKTQLTALDKTVKTHSDTIESVRVNLSMLATLTQAENTQRQVMEAQLANDREQSAALLAERERILSGDDYREAAEALQAELSALETQESALLADKKKTEEERETLSRTLGEYNKTQSRHQIRLAELGKDIASGELTLDHLADTLAQLRDTDAVSKEESAALDEKQKSCEETIAGNKTALLSLHKEEADAESERRICSDAARSYEQKTNELRIRQKEQTHTKDLLFEAYTKTEAKRNDALSEKEKKVTSLWDEYELSYSGATALGYPPVTEETRSRTAAQASALKSQIKALGTVNVAAVTEYAAVKERYDFMTAQVNDLEKSKTDLADIIFRLEGEMRTRFADAMRDINQCFQNVFRELFGGGHAELILTEPDNILESGIEINVAPPGKIIKSLMLLSGGEQAFVAIALYFALLRVNPSPFCFLDEIEAALDEVNVDKFAAYLRRYANETQYIVITHRRGTMEAADRLYGVTMAEKGISTVLSVDTGDIGRIPVEGINPPV